MSACSKNETKIPIDDSFLTGIPCQPPCWYGLELEKSSYEESKNLLKTLPFINLERIWEREDSTGSFLEYSCVNSGLTLCGSLYFNSEGILQSISIQQHIDLSLSQTIESLGEPSGLQIGHYHVGCVFQVYWLTKNISAETIITPDRRNKCETLKGGEIDEDIVIEWLIYSTYKPFESDLMAWP